MALFGAVNTLSSLAMGRISDRWGNKPLVITGFLAHLSFYACFFAAITLRGTHWFTEREYLLYLGAAVYGVGDAAANTFPNIICSLYFTDNAEAAFSNLKFFQVRRNSYPTNSCSPLEACSPSVPVPWTLLQSWSCVSAFVPSLVFP